MNDFFEIEKLSADTQLLRNYKEICSGGRNITNYERSGSIILTNTHREQAAHTAQNGIFFGVVCLQIAYECANLEDLLKLPSNNRQLNVAASK